MFLSLRKCCIDWNKWKSNGAMVGKFSLLCTLIHFFPLQVHLAQSNCALSCYWIMSYLLTASRHFPIKDWFTWYHHRKKLYSQLVHILAVQNEQFHEHSLKHIKRSFWSVKLGLVAFHGESFQKHPYNFDYPRTLIFISSDQIIKKHYCILPWAQYVACGGLVNFLFFGQIMQDSTPGLHALLVCCKCSWLFSCVWLFLYYLI